LSGVGSLQVGLDAVDYLLGLSDKVRAKYRPLSRLNLVERCKTSMTIQCFERRHLETLLITVVVRELNQRQKTCPICPDSSTNKLGAYLQELGPLSPFDHWSADAILNCGSDASPKKHAVAPKIEQQTRVLGQNDGLGHTM
jgi:hypothetical protein